MRTEGIWGGLLAATATALLVGCSGSDVPPGEVNAAQESPAAVAPAPVVTERPTPTPTPTGPPGLGENTAALLGTVTFPMATPDGYQASATVNVYDVRDLDASDPVVQTCGIDPTQFAVKAARIEGTFTSQVVNGFTWPIEFYTLVVESDWMELAGVTGLFAGSSQCVDDIGPQQVAFYGSGAATTEPVSFAFDYLMVRERTPNSPDGYWGEEGRFARHSWEIYYGQADQAQVTGQLDVRWGAGQGSIVID